MKLKLSRDTNESSHAETINRDSWTIKPFEDCIEKVRYTTKIQRTAFLDEGLYPVVSQEEGLINGYWNDEADVFRVARPITIFGDHTKILKYIDFDFVLGADGVKLLQSKSFLDPQFFHYQMRSFTLKSLGYARHYRLLKEMRISYPALLSEQRRIAAALSETLDCISSAEAATKGKLEMLTELQKSVLHNAFNQSE